MKLSDLAPNPKNPRTITDKKLEMLKKSMQEFGSLDGVIFNQRTNRLVGGHMRQKSFPDSAVTLLTKYQTPTRTGTIAEGFVEIDGERFPYRIVDWDEKKEMAGSIAANKGAGAWDFPELSNWFTELDDGAFDLDLTMFDAEERENIVVPVTHVPPEGDPDHIPEPPKEPITKPGDLWTLGNHRLLCGDSTNIQHVERLMGGQKAKLWSSDPPYGISYVSNQKSKGFDSGYKEIENDDKQDEELKEFILSVISTSLPFLDGNFAFYMWHAMKMQAYFSQAAAAAGILFHRQIIWVKPQFVFGRGHYHWRHELCLMGWLKGNEPPFYGERNQSSVWEIGKENDKIHPTQKPVEIFAIPIRNHLKPQQIVYEPFCGSGSNIIAAEKENARCYAMEIDPVYVDCTVKRWEKYTGRKAELSNA